MKDRRKKIFLMSMLSFLVISSCIYVFLIINAVEDMKKRSYFVSNYTATQRALLPIFKYLNIIESESISSLAKSLIPNDFEKVNEIFNINSPNEEVNASSAISKNEDSLYNNSSNLMSGNYIGSKESFKPKTKLSSSLSPEISGGGGSSNTSKNFSSLSGVFSQSLSNKNISIDKRANTNPTTNLQDEQNKLMARLNYTKSSLDSALKSKSADSARLDWDRGFSGSIKPDGKMFYKNSSVELDKIKSGVLDLEFGDNKKGLYAPDVSAPKIESTVPPDKAKEMLKNLTQDMAKSMINSLTNAIGGGAVSEGKDPQKESDSIIAEDKAANHLTQADEEKIRQEVEKWKFEPDENVVTTYFSCDLVDCNKIGVNGNGFYKAYFPDGFVLTLNSSGKVIDYYYCVSPVNEAAFIQNYQKYVVGKK